jgi:phosphate starvation-inducible PhoH-like protein
MPVETLTYESPQFLQKLMGHDLAGLRVVAELFGVHLTSRDSWVRIDGESSAVQAAREVFIQLEKVGRQGGDISPAMIRLVSESVQTEQGDHPAESIMMLKLTTSNKKPPVLAKTRSQIGYVQAMRDHEVVFGVGPAGTGKTYLAMAHGLHLLREKSVQRLILTRPAVEAGEALGFLPGDLKEKIFPYLRPLYDALYEMMELEEAERLIEKGAIEIAPLAYMRGRTLKNAFIILDEAQNTTTEQMLMFLTRLGEGARCVITGDPSQVDLRRHVKSGLREAVEVLQGVPGVRFVNFLAKDIVRLPVVQRIIEAYDRHRKAADQSKAAQSIQMNNK